MILARITRDPPTLTTATKTSRPLNCELRLFGGCLVFHETWLIYHLLPCLSLFWTIYTRLTADIGVCRALFDQQPDENSPVDDHCHVDVTTETATFPFRCCTSLHSFIRHHHHVRTSLLEYHGRPPRRDQKPPHFMFDYRDSPPPLTHSPVWSGNHSPSASRELSPTTPPVSSLSPGRSSTLPWVQRALAPAKATTSVCFEDSIGQAYLDDSILSQVGALSSTHMAAPGWSTQLDTRQNSTSPRGNQPSVLTAALKTQESAGPSTSRTNMNPPKPSLLQQESSDAQRHENGARPIAFKSRQPYNNARRESLAQSINMGMSWGGVSVGSWIRDE